MPDDGLQNLRQLPWDKFYRAYCVNQWAWEIKNRPDIHHAPNHVYMPRCLEFVGKLLQVCELTLSNTKSSVGIKKDFSQPFDTKGGFRQGDSLSYHFINLLPEKIIRAAELNRAGALFYKSVQLLAYADDIDIFGHNSRLDKKAKQVGLVVNEDKTKYISIIMSLNKQSSHSGLGFHLTVDIHNFEAVENFV